MLCRQARAKLCLLIVALASSSKSFKIENPGSCHGVDINGALREAREMATNAANQLQQSLDGRLPAHEELRISLNYSPWFGDHTTLDTNHQPQSAGQQDRAQSVIATLGTMRDLVDTGLPGVAIACDDPPLVTTQEIDPATGNRVHKRTFSDKHGTQFTWPQGTQTCAQNPNQIGYTVSSLQLVVICRANFPKLRTLVDPPRHVRRNDGAALGDERTLSNILLHELMHLLPGNPMLADQSGGTDPNGEHYNYDGCNKLRQKNVNLTPHNPDSIALVALTLFLDGNNWSSGVASPLLKS